MGRAYSVRKASIEKSGAKKGKLYTNYAKEIYLVAKNGIADPELNPDLKRLIERAKRDQVPNDIINRAIDKVNSPVTDNLEEVTYEGFGPGASTFIIKCLTDNVHRTVGMVRAAFNKVNKSLGVTNSVSYNYDYLGVVSFISDQEEEVFNKIVDSGIEIIDIENENGEITIYSKPSDIHRVKDILKEFIPNIEYTFDEVGMFPKDLINLEGEELEEFQKLSNLLDEIEDVNKVYHNVNEEQI